MCRPLSGPEPMAILQDMMGRYNVFPIAGNHDFAAFLALRSLTTELTDDSIQKMEENHDFEQMFLWLSDGGSSTLEAFKNLTKDEQQDILEYPAQKVALKRNAAEYLKRFPSYDFRQTRRIDMSNLSDFIIETGVLEEYRGSGGDVVIPVGVTEIGENAFDGCSSLTSIEIPSGVTVIGSEAFSGCVSLTSINLPSGVTKIRGRAFSDCTSLRSIEIPSSVKDIDWDAFENCTDLTIYAEPDSYAERYAKNHHFQYKASGKRSN